MADKHSSNLQIKCPTAAQSGKTKKKELNKVSVKELKRQHVEISPSQTPDEYEPSCKQLHSKDSRGKSVELSDSFSNSSKQDLTSNLELQSSVGNTQNIHMENVTIINSKVAIQKIGSTTTSEGCSTSNEITSIGNLRENLETEAKEIVPLGLKFDESNFPCVHPNLSKTDFYKGGSTKMSEDYMPSSRQSYTPSKAEKITFEQLYRNVTPKSYTGLVGAAGSGKTTFAKRLSKTTNLTWIILLCMDLDYGSDKLTLKQLLIDYAYPELNEKKANDLFSLMLKNPEQFGIILDGYDQATWSLDKIRPKNASYTTPLLVEELVANLCNRKFLPDIAIVLTSRPHSIVTINEILRPKEVVLVHEFTYENMKTVFFAFADKEANRIWNKFDREAPMLLELCLTPIMLQLIILAALGSDDVTELRNVTQVFTILLENLRRSEYAKGHDINVIKHKLSKIAYNATKKATVVMTFLQMDEAGLSDVKVQDIIIAVPGYQRFNQKLFDGDKKFYFTHQLFQEYFSAIHISQNMDLDEFRQNVKQIVSDPHWGMVRRFLCGLLLDNNFIVPESVDNSQQSTNKSVLFYSQLLSHYQESPDLELIVDLWECTSEVLQAFAEHFPDEAAFDGKTFRTSDAHALEMMLQHVKTVKQISLMNCGLTNQSFKHICNAIGSLPNKVKV